MKFVTVLLSLSLSMALSLVQRSTIKDRPVSFVRLNAKKKGKSGSISTKGFGRPSIDIDSDRSPGTLTFYEALQRQGVNCLKKTALAYFGPLRGLVALQDFSKGDEIVNIPYSVAINLGPQGDDPTIPALEFLRDYCQDRASLEPGPRRAYYDLLPPFGGADVMGSTDFWSEEALEALQSPLIVEETLQRRQRTARRYATIDESFPTWIDGSPVTEQHLLWAVWLITSRVLTVQGTDDKQYRLLIPFLDMANHDRSSPHVLTGRAVPGGELKVTAGGRVKAGEQVNICYGGGVAGNDRFIQDYGFLDPAEDAYWIVAQTLLGKMRIREGSNVGRSLPEADREKALQALRTTTIAFDEAALANEKDESIRTAISYRLGVKKALSKFIIMS